MIGVDTATDPHIHGVFVDSGFTIAASNPNMTYASRCDLQLAQLTAFRRICDLMAAHGKVVAVSLKTHFSTILDRQGMLNILKMGRCLFLGPTISATNGRQICTTIPLFSIIV